MVLIGLLLLAGAVVVGIDVAATNDFAMDVEAFNQVFSTTVGGVFVAGAVTGLVAAFGIMLLHDGGERRKVRRRELRETEAERDRLATAYREEHADHRAAREVADERSLDLRDRELAQERERELDPDRDRDRERHGITTF